MSYTSPLHVAVQPATTQPLFNTTNQHLRPSFQRYRSTPSANLTTPLCPSRPSPPQKMRPVCAAFLLPLPRPKTPRTRTPLSRSQTRASTPSPTPLPKPGVSAAIFRITSDPSPQILLVQRGKPPNQYLWALPGGGQNPDESPMHAILREIQEETAILPEQLDLLPTPVNSLLVANGAWRLQVFAGVCTQHVEPIPGDDALQARFWSTELLPGLRSVPNLESIIREAASKLPSILKDNRS